jgi:energy-coupling factor transport system ATP-binding protein
METKRVVFSDVTFHYQHGDDSGSQALEIENICFEEGKCYIITGACGSGKTTLAMLLKGLIKPVSGSIVLEKNNESLTEFQRDIGFAFQCPEEQFFKETVSEEIAFGPTMLGHEGIAESVEESLRAVGLPAREFRQRNPFELSSGEKRRVAIASVIACHPSWYLFDEPTAGLDPEGKELLVALIEGLVRKGKTLLIITQELALFSRLCDEIVLLDQGKLLLKTGVKAFFEHEGIETAVNSFPYHTKVLRVLQQRGWDVRVSILDAAEAASRIAASME